MLKVGLVNMPFAAAQLPSIALTQLRAVLASELPGRVEATLFYLNLDFFELLGQEVYELMSNSVEANTAGLGDWFFRSEAFPELPDNSEAYLRRHFSEHRRQLDAFQGPLAEKRSGVGTFLDRLIDQNRLDTYQVIGLTSMFSQNLACFALARKLKERNPGVVVVMGGANCETSMGQVLARNVGQVDFVFSGPSLRSFPRLVRHLVEGELEKCHQLKGVFSKAKLAHSEGSGSEVGDELPIDEDVALDYDDYLAALDRKRLSQVIEPNIVFETSRGCWWGERSHCTFCGLNGVTMNYRAMNPEKALRLFASLFDRYASRASVFQSVDNILPRQYLTDVIPYLQTPENVSIFYEIKADLKRHEAEALSKARVKRLQPGIEALATSTLKLMRKGTTSFQNLRFLKYCLTFHIDPAWNLLIGFPGEEEEVYEKYYRDLPLLTHFPPPAGVYPVRFDRFSPYFMQAKEYGLKLRPCDFYEMIYPFPKSELPSMAYYFVDDNYGAPYIRNTAKWVGKLRERIHHWHARWFEEDGGARPELSFRPQAGSRIVHDTRSGRLVQHHIDALELRILDLLAAPMKLEHLCARLGDASEGEVSRHVGALEVRGLLFREGPQYMSLVLEEAPEEDAIPQRQQDAAEQFNFAAAG